LLLKIANSIEIISYFFYKFLEVTFFKGPTEVNSIPKTTTERLSPQTSIRKLDCIQ
jgi:hypothetical protein